MTNQILQEVSCPNCLSPIDVREHGRHVQCTACDSQFLLEGHFCPKCNAYHDKEATVCGQCSSPISRTCAKCNTRNWAGDEYCTNCGSALDIFDVITRRHHEAFTAHRADQRRTIKALKQQEELASMKRWEEIMEQEQARQETMRRRLAKRKAQEQRTIAMVVGMLLIFLLIVGAFALLSAGG